MSKRFIDFMRCQENDFYVNEWSFIFSNASRHKSAFLKESSKKWRIAHVLKTYSKLEFLLFYNYLTKVKKNRFLKHIRPYKNR